MCVWLAVMRLKSYPNASLLLQWTSSSSIIQSPLNRLEGLIHRANIYSQWWGSIYLMWYVMHHPTPYLLSSTHWIAPLTSFVSWYSTSTSSPLTFLWFISGFFWWIISYLKTIRHDHNCHGQHLVCTWLYTVYRTILFRTFICSLLPWILTYSNALPEGRRALLMTDKCWLSVCADADRLYFLVLTIMLSAFDLIFLGLSHCSCIFSL